MGAGRNLRTRYQSPSQRTKERRQGFVKGIERPIKILLAHDNRIDYHTDKAHRFAEWLKEKKEFQVIYDQDYWKKGEKTSKTETDRRELEMVKNADIIVRLMHPPSKSGEERHEGAKREFRKAMNAKKPIIEIYYMGARMSPTRPSQEKNYRFRIPVHIKRGERLEKAIRRGLNNYKKIKESD